jgi:capsular exopolysaccharide synthesis family protein
LRRGRLAELLRVERSPGLMEVLRGETAVEDAIRSTALESLDIVTGGRRAGDPGELLTVEFASILGRLEEQYEAVVIDGTPVVPVNDARIISRYVDATILVASAGAATRRQVRAAVDRLSLIGVRPAAVVLNNSRERGDSSYYYVTEPPEPTLRAGKTKARGAVR